MKQSVLKAVALACMAAAPIAASAQMTYTAEKWYDDRWYIAPFGTYTFADSARRSDDGFGFGVAYGKAINPSWDLELRGSYEQLDRAGSPTDWQVTTLGVDGKWYFSGREGVARWSHMQFYGLVGAGGIWDRVGNYGGGIDTDLSPYLNAGLGMAYPFSWGRFYVDGRYRYDFNMGNRVSGSAFGDWVITAGLQIPFGPKPAVAAPPAPPLPAPVMAPPPPPPAPPPPPPPPAPVTRNFNISADGMFAFDSAVLTPEGKIRLDNMQTEARQAGITSVTSMTIVGHTDPLGSDAYNQKLSEARANSVRDYVASKGVSSSVIRTEGRGETQLKVTEADCKAKGQAKTRQALIACLAPDRRVEIMATGVQSK